MSRSAQDEHLGGLVAQLASSPARRAERAEERFELSGHVRVALLHRHAVGRGLKAAQGGQVVVEVERTAPGERAQAQLARMAHVRDEAPP
jgi:hypothetical protein